jgi:3-oxoacyl-[acyl-carrier protein] reductase
MCERGFGRIVNITSSAVKAPIDFLGLSNGARTGLTGFVAGTARQARIASRGVTINNLLPGSFDTDRLRAGFGSVAAKSGQTLEQVMEARRKLVPAGRFGTAEEFGAVCAFICSAQAGYLNAQNILLDGGAYPGTF